MAKYDIAIVGCGAIFDRHIMAINANKEYFNLIGIYDVDTQKASKYANDYNIIVYDSLDELYKDPKINCVVILTPSNLHYNHALQAITAKKHVILEKPACFYAHEIEDLIHKSNLNNVNIFCVLQVRLNKSIAIVKATLDQKLLGDIRGVSFIQRWQRPHQYFNNWRGKFLTSGGILREFAIHYLDIMQYLVGVPSITAAQFHKTKFKDTDVDDSIYALCDYESFGGSIEVSVASEPSNLECSLSIMGSNGYIKLAGKSLDVIDVAKFLNEDNLTQFDQISSSINSLEFKDGVSHGACPHHPELYRLIVENPELFDIKQTYNVISLIEDIYKFKGDFSEA